jgi:glycosyltransferase involved in cell wall biosynthesis
METLVIGPMPPPLGGISVYLYRLRKKCPEMRFLDEAKMGKRDWLKLLLLPGRHFIYHSPSLAKRLFLSALASLNRSAFTLVVHGASLQDQYASANVLMRFLIRKMLRRALRVQVVNPAIELWLKQRMGIPAAKVETISSFLPPPAEDEAGILGTYGPDTRAFLADRFPLIVANAHRLCFHEGTDLYGLDLCLRLVAELKARGSDRVGLVFALAQTGDEGYFRKMRAFCREAGIEENVHFLTGQREIWPLFKTAQLMVRPTCTDGFGISVAEAVHFGCPAVASNVCRRAEGTVLFENRDFGDFLAKCQAALKGKGNTDEPRR